MKKFPVKIRNFPQNFLWGASTSAYQVEGAAFEDGKKASQQDVINQQSFADKGYATAEIASDHYHHYKEDVALMKEMGFSAYRFSLAWSRIFPDGKGEVNRLGLDFYHDLIDELLASGIEPIVTLYHDDLPWALVEKYTGWLSRDVVADFEAYARYVITEFKDKVKYWTTINDQSIIVQFWTQKCYIPPALYPADQLRFQINHHLSLAHAVACNLVHEIVPNGLVGPAISYVPLYPLTSKPEDVLATQNAHDLRNTFYLDSYFKGIYPKAAMTYLEDKGLAPIIKPGDLDLIKSGKSDYLAINYASSETVKACPDDSQTAIRFSGVNWTGKKGELTGYERHPGFYEMCSNPHLETTAWDCSIDPIGLEYSLREIYTRYNIPMLITENGFGANDELTEERMIHDEYRIDYLRDHIKAMKRAMDAGVEMLGY